jgi:alpha-tubulin suppressor-like RCC1 family protein
MRSWTVEHHALWSVCAVLLVCNSASMAATPMISLGSDYAVALRSDGTVMTWGGDGAGQLGTGRLPFSTTPGLVVGLDSVKSIGAGVTHSLAVRSDGTVWAWGANGEGQLGVRSNTDRARAAQVQGISNVISVCGGDSYSLALKIDATVWAWGAGNNGALGNGSFESASAPMQVKNLDRVTAIACGNSHALALRQDGSVWSWGSNNDGELGDGSTALRSQPVQVQGLSGVTSVSAGEYFSVALKSDGTVWEWGVRDGYADPHGKPRVVPGRSAGISGAVAIAASLDSFNVIAVHADQQTWWNWETGKVPVTMAPAGPIKSVAYAYGQFLFVKTDGTVLAGGGGGFGSLGDGTTTYRDAPGPVADISKIVQVATGQWHGLALDANGKVWSWGADWSGQLGSGRILGRSLPGEVAGLSNIVQIEAGALHTHAVDRDGNVWAWGDNGYGQYGNDSYSSSATPLRLETISAVQSVASGAWFTLALQRDGTLWQWGSMVTSQFDAPALPNRLLDNVTAIAAGPDYGLALRGDGTVWSWGSNQEHQLGDGTTVDQLRPRIVPGISGIKLITAADNSSYAVRQDGTVMAWGANEYGQLGDGTTEPRTGPVAVAGLTDVVDIVAGLQHVLVRKRDGTIWGWNWSADSGELGSVSAGIAPKAAPIPELGAIQSMAAGAYVSAFVRDDGLVMMGGKNDIGQLGDGTFAVRSTLGLVVNANADGFLNLGSGAAGKVAPSLAVPFFVTATGGVTNKIANVATTTKFNPADKGKQGAVHITASVPSSSSLAQSAKGSNAAIGPHPNRAAGTTTDAFTLLQLTPTGWQTVTNGQLLPYASGVLGDQLAAQTILNNTDTSTLKGAEFCVGYGATAQDMASNGNIRSVATIPGGTASTSCVVGGTLSVALSVVPGWNLLGNPVNQSIAVAAKFGDAAKVNSVWKWDSTAAKWQFYSPSLSATELQSYAASQGYAVLSEIAAGDGFWVNAKTQADLGNLTGAAINLRQSSLSAGWNLVSTASAVTPQDFNLSLSTTPPTAGQVPVNLTSLWAWDSAQSQWYFYAPSLEAGALSQFISDKGYRDFGTNSKTVGNATGFWVRRP